jgi:hypothetical protein
MAYILDDRLAKNSAFNDIVRQNKLNYTAFLKDAHKTKKPDRLRQYITEDCPFAQKTVLLHDGREKVTQTLKRDLEGLFTLLEKRVCVALCCHEAEYYCDVFRTVLEEISDYGKNIDCNSHQNPHTSATSIANIPKVCFEADFYYEGGSKALKCIEEAMKAQSLGIVFISKFALEEQDL